MPAMPPKPPSPKGDCPTLGGGGAAELGDDDEGVVEDGVDPAAGVVEAGAAEAPDEPGQADPASSEATAEMPTAPSTWLEPVAALAYCPLVYLGA